MSYRPSNQSLSDPLDELLKSLSRENINDLASAIEAREDSGEWNLKHIDEMNALLIDARILRSKIKRLSNAHW
jgi:hypothetical protein